jgi:hypothetical protein
MTTCGEREFGGDGQHSTATTSAGILGVGARRIRHLHSRGVRAGPRRSAGRRPSGEGEEVGGIRGARSTAGGERRDGGARKTRHARASGPSVLIRRPRMVSGTRVARRLISAVRSATSGADSDRTAGDMPVRSPRNSSFRRLPAVQAVPHATLHRRNKLFLLQADGEAEEEQQRKGKRERLIPSAASFLPSPLLSRGENDKKLPHLCRMCQLATTFDFLDT